MLELAVSSLTYEGFADTQYGNLFAKAFREGYRNVEFNCWHAASLTPDRMRYLRKRCADAGLRPVALHVAAFGGNSSEEIAWNAAHKLRAIEAALELGCRRVVASVSEKAGSLDGVVEELAQIEPLARKEQVLICLENHCSNPLAVSADYQVIFDRIDSPQIGIALDGGHLEAAGEEITSFIRLLGDRINHLHLKENRYFGRKSFCRFGSGGTDNGRMISLMLQRGFSGYMSVELSPEIGESGESIAFGSEDRSRPVEMFSRYEDRRAPGAKGQAL